jgi:N-acetylmuramoyl-L-alanine amidase
MLSQRNALRSGARLGAVTLLAVAALGACGGSDASPSTTLQPLGPTNFATIPPVDDTGVDSTGVDNPIPSEEIYTVQAGDALSIIASRFGVTAQEIADYNDWEDGINHPIFPGNEIKIPGGERPAVTDPPAAAATTTTTTTAPSTGGGSGTYEVQAGDYLSGIASKFDTTAQAIVQANGWTDGVNHAIYPGDIIKLP